MNDSTCFSSKEGHVSLQRTSITTTPNFLVISSSIKSSSSSDDRRQNCNTEGESQRKESSNGRQALGLSSRGPFKRRTSRDRQSQPTPVLTET